MFDRDSVVKEVVELLKLWALVRAECGPNGWAGANAVLIERINQLCRSLE